jgi:hypothetical protein
MRFDLPEQYDTVVAGCAGWALSGKRTAGLAKKRQVVLADPGKQPTFWRWQQGHLQQGNVRHLKAEAQNRTLAGYTVVDKQEPVKPLRHVAL